MPFKLGDFVRYKTGGHADAFAKGRVSAIEQYQDHHGTRTWIYVRWFDPDGMPKPDDVKFAAPELELIQDK
jgi:hypothetical protein